MECTASPDTPASLWILVEPAQGSHSPAYSNRLTAEVGGWHHIVRCDNRWPGAKQMALPQLQLHQYTALLLAKELFQVLQRTRSCAWSGLSPP